MSTIVVRGSTDNYMDDIERAIDDGVNVFKGLCKVSVLMLFLKTFKSPARKSYLEVSSSPKSVLQNSSFCMFDNNLLRRTIYQTRKMPGCRLLAVVFSTLVAVFSILHVCS